MTHRRTGFNLRLGRPDRCPTVLAALQFGRNVNPGGRLGISCSTSACNCVSSLLAYFQLSDLCLQALA